MTYTSKQGQHSNILQSQLSAIPRCNIYIFFNVIQCVFQQLWLLLDGQTGAVHTYTFLLQQQGCLQVDICLVLIEQNKGLAMDSTLVTDKVVEHLTKCMDYHQLKIVIIPIDYIISVHCHGKIEMVQKSFYTLLFISLSPKVI